jgi:hypothetical protein
MSDLNLHQDVKINGKNYRVTSRATKGGVLTDVIFMIHNLADVSSLHPRMLVMEILPLPIPTENVTNHNT